MTIHLYGIPNCDTVKKARSWLDGRGIGYTFHDYKKEGADAGKVAAWIAAAAQPSLIKRPVVEWPGRTTVGFKAEDWQSLARPG